MVYIITSGSYSDYHIVAVFTDKKKAEHFLKIYNQTTNSLLYKADMETWKVTDDAVDIAKNEVLIEYVFNLPSGREYTHILHPGEDEVRRVDSDRLIERSDIIGRKYSVFQFMLDIGNEKYPESNDEWILKIAHDRYAAYKAREEGIS